MFTLKIQYLNSLVTISENSKITLMKNDKIKLFPQKRSRIRVLKCTRQNIYKFMHHIRRLSNDTV